MRYLAGLFILLLFACVSPEKEPNYAFTNGLWYNGESFEETIWYVTNGAFTKTAPAQMDQTIDLKKRYVIPPFGDAHTHSIELKHSFSDINLKFMGQGVFYAKNPNCVARAVDEIRKTVAEKHTVDAIFSNAGFTCTSGHPSLLYSVKQDVYPGLNMVGNAYYETNDSAAVDSIWKIFLFTQPDFVKTYLLYTCKDGQGNCSPEEYTIKGLEPNVINLIVDKAHKEKLSVSCHVENAIDFHFAVEAGVDEINHLPGYGPAPSVPDSLYIISNADAKVAAKNEISVVTTLCISNEMINNFYITKSQLKMQEIQAKNLQILKAAGVEILLGSDYYTFTVIKEALHVAKLGVFTNNEMLQMLCYSTPKAIFPNRKIAAFKEGYEASFLVLNNNPLEDLESIKSIEMMMKQGILLSEEDLIVTIDQNDEVANSE